MALTMRPDNRLEFWLDCNKHNNNESLVGCAVWPISGEGEKKIIHHVGHDQFPATFRHLSPGVDRHEGPIDVALLRFILGTLLHQLR